jgi:hypothetical protein
MRLSRSFITYIGQLEKKKDKAQRLVFNKKQAIFIAFD